MHSATHVIISAVVIVVSKTHEMSFDPAWANHFSDPAWVAIELYARVVSPLRLFAELPDVPYYPCGGGNWGYSTE